MYAALRYAENDDKTDKKMFVGGINCSKQNAYAEMVAVQRRFGMKGKVVAYHGIQSFKPGEITPEQAFEIGKETAMKMWGDKYQVLVTVHLNTHLFKEYTNQSVKKYINNLRIKQAERLLVTTDLPIGNIATLCGFADTNYFSTAFKKNVGLSPVKYRTNDSFKKL